MDIDGSVTGVKGGAWMLSDVSMSLTPDCTFRAEWQAWVCPPFAEGFAQLTFTNEEGGPPTEGVDGNDHPANSTSDRKVAANLHFLGSPNRDHAGTSMSRRFTIPWKSLETSELRDHIE